jgi:hypothetical protein
MDVSILPRVLCRVVNHSSEPSYPLLFPTRSSGTRVWGDPSKKRGLRISRESPACLPLPQTGKKAAVFQNLLRRPHHTRLSLESVAVGRTQKATPARLFLSLLPCSWAHATKSLAPLPRVFFFPPRPSALSDRHTDTRTRETQGKQEEEGWAAGGAGLEGLAGPCGPVTALSCFPERRGPGRARDWWGSRLRGHVARFDPGGRSVSPPGSPPSSQPLVTSKHSVVLGRTAGDTEASGKWLLSDAVRGTDLKSP